MATKSTVETGNRVETHFDSGLRTFSVVCSRTEYLYLYCTRTTTPSTGHLIFTSESRLGTGLGTRNWELGSCTENPGPGTVIRWRSVECFWMHLRHAHSETHTRTDLSMYSLYYKYRNIIAIYRYKYKYLYFLHWKRRAHNRSRHHIL